MKRAFFKPVLAILPLLEVLAMPGSACLAWDGWANWCGWHPQQQVFDGSTLCAWQRTFYGPNALATPLGEFYIPRTPACSGCDGYVVGCGYAVGEPVAACDGMNGEHATTTTDPAYPPSASPGFAPVKFERLGQVPNELDVAGGLGSSGQGAPRASAPAR